MNVSLDLVTSTIVMGILIVMVFSSNVLVMEASAESRVSQQLQTVANTAVSVLEEEVKYLVDVEIALDSTLVFIEKTSSTADSVRVMFTKNGDKLNVSRAPKAGGASTTTTYNMKLNEITFDETFHGTSSAPFLSVTVITVSRDEEEFGNNGTLYATASRDIYLKNLHVAELFMGGN